MVKENDVKTVEKNEAQKSAESAESAKQARPFPVDVFADNENYYLEASLPGAAKESIDITVDHENRLTILASRKSAEKIAGQKTIYEEYENSDYKRVFHIDEKVDTEKVEAAYKNGVLRVRLPLKAPVVRKVKITAGS